MLYYFLMVFVEVLLFLFLTNTVKPLQKPLKNSSSIKIKIFRLINNYILILPIQ